MTPGKTSDQWEMTTQLLPRHNEMGYAPMM